VKRCFAAILACGLSGCIYTGSARDLRPDALQRERGWIGVEGVLPLRQHAEHDCGPIALQMVLRYWHKPAPQRALLTAQDARVPASELRDDAREAGLLSYVMEGSFEDILYELRHGRPVIVGMAKPTPKGAVAHYEVVIGIHPATRRVATLDPAFGWRQNSLEGFLREWLPTGSVLIVFMPRESEDAPREISASPRVEDGYRRRE